MFVTFGEFLMAAFFVLVGKVKLNLDRGGEQYSDVLFAFIVSFLFIISAIWRIVG